MPEIGGPSNVVEDEPRDIHVVCETLIRSAEPEQLVTVEGGDDEEESDPEMEEDPEPEEEEMAEDGDEPILEGMPVMERGVIGLMADRITEMEEQVETLQEENHALHHMKEQYETLVHHLVVRNAGLSEQRNTDRDRIVQLLQDKDALNGELEAMKAEFDLEIADKIRIEDAWVKAARRVDNLEGEVRSKKAKIDNMSYAFDTAFGRWVDRVRQHPAEDGQTVYTMSRQRMVRMGGEEHQDAVRRGMLG